MQLERFQVSGCSIVGPGSFKYDQNLGVLGCPDREYPDKCLKTPLEIDKTLLVLVGYVNQLLAEIFTFQHSLEGIDSIV